MDIRIKRIYDPVSESDGERVLVDRLWPHGFTPEDACIDGWVRELAPSTELRRWFGNEPKRFAEFQRRYMAELADRQPQLANLRHRACSNTVTLVYSARRTEHNNAIVLAEVLRERLQAQSGPSSNGGWEARRIATWVGPPGTSSSASSTTVNPKRA